MRYGLDITSAGPWGRPDQIAELATLAEDHGWDGVFCEDYLAFPGGGATYDVWVTLALVAQATTRLTIGTMVTPVPARHVPDPRAPGRVGGGGRGRAAGARRRQRRPARAIRSSATAGPGPSLLESGLATVRAACPDVPVWVGGAITKPGPRARARCAGTARASTACRRRSGRT